MFRERFSLHHPGTRTFSRHLLILIAPLAVACGSSGSGPLNGQGNDAGPNSDHADATSDNDGSTSSNDACNCDAGVQGMDALAFDASSPDAVVLPDAQPVFDAAAADAFTLDAVVFDATTVDATTPDATSLDAAVGRDAQTSDGFAVAQHPPLPQVPNQGGPLLAHPRLVVITFAEDPNSATIAAHARWIVTSQWLAMVGPEYGIGQGSIVGVVNTMMTAPQMATDADVQNLLVTGIQNNSFPRPTGGSFTDTLYMIYFPQRTTILLPNGDGTNSTSCMDFGGYHSETDSMQPLHFSYAVIPFCSAFDPNLTDIENDQISASHELFEAATDSLPLTNPAYALSQNDPNPSSWLFVGGELGDLCALPARAYREAGFVAQRVWSNQAAAANTRDPCVPADPAHPFFVVQPTPQTVQGVSAGSSIQYQLSAWSTAPMAAWSVSASATQGSFMPTVSVMPSSMSNGSQGTMQVTIPAGAPRNGSALIMVTSAISQTEFQLWPVAIVVQ
jgi:hypothetical protein